MATASQALPDNERDPIFVVTPSENGFHVYAAHDPSLIYEVSGNYDRPECTCPDFAARRGVAGYRCQHILAAHGRLSALEGGSVASAYTPSAQSGMPGANPNADGATSLSPAQLSLKRSISPDGRIDSLSIEFLLPVGLNEHVLGRALGLLAQQEDIIREFLAPRKSRNGNGAQPAPQQQQNGAVPAMLRDIQGMQTRHGWRYFINVEVNGQVHKLFGRRNELGDHLAAAGYTHLAGNIAKGVALNVPCLAVLVPSDDGKYLNVERIQPNPQGNGRAQ